MKLKGSALALAAVLVASPSWAMFKCVVDGKTSFQEQPCAAGQAQTKLTPQYAPSPAAAPIPVDRPTALEATQDALAKLEQERLRHETEYALRDKRAELDRFRARCDAEVRAIAARRNGFNDNVAGAMRGQAEAAAAGAFATNCQTQARALESEVEDLRRQCTERRCTPL